MIRVTAVHPDSIAAELGLREGTELLSVNGRELEDFLDWEFLTAEEAFLLHVRQPDGEEIEFDIERPLGEPLGVALEPPESAAAPTAVTSASWMDSLTACGTCSTSATMTIGSPSATAISPP